MVATRRRGNKPATQELDGEDSINVYVPQTPKRKLVEEEEEFYTPPTSKKPRVGKKHTAGAIEDDKLANTRPVVEIPAIIPPPAAEIIEFEEDEEANEPLKILDPLPVRTRNGETKVSEDVVQYPDLGAIEGESSDDVEEGNQTEEEQDDGQEPATETISEAEPTSSLPEPIQAGTGRRSNDNSRSRTTDTMVPLSLHGSILPALLPAELLQNEELISTTELTDIKPQVKPKKTKFFDEVAKPPKDRRIGTTTYRVTKSSSLQLAPKASARSRSKKEAWLQGRSGTKGGNRRKPFSSGFFVAKR